MNIPFTLEGFRRRISGRTPEPRPASHEQAAVAATIAPEAERSPREAVLAELASTSHSIVRLVDALVAWAHGSGASDIHVVPERGDVRVRFRIDGVLRDVLTLPASLHAEFISRIKVLAALRTDEHQAAQDGRFRAEVGGEPVDVRVSVAPTYHGENVVLRLLSGQAAEQTLASLGFSAGNTQKILGAVARPHGMVLTTGPTGSGKTTTLYTLVKGLSDPGVSIVTIEDPIEYSIAGIAQIPVNPRTNLTFAAGLRSILRQDPNIIMVGEIRDAETAGLAVNVSLTGHLVLSTLHTNDAVTALPRLLDLKVEPYLVASTVTAVVGQRLVRTVCGRCRTEHRLSEAERSSLVRVFPRGTLKGSRTFFRGAGCDACGGTGYAGRIGVQEVLVVDEAIRDAVMRKAAAAELRALAATGGMVPMLEDALSKAAAGTTSVEEVLRMFYD